MQPNTRSQPPAKIATKTSCSDCRDCGVGKVLAESVCHGASVDAIPERALLDHRKVDERIVLSPVVSSP